MQETLSQFATIENLLLILSGTVVLVVILLFWVIFLSLRLRRIFRGKNMHSLEDVLAKLLTKSRDAETFAATTNKELEQIHGRIARAIIAPKVTRFDAFAGTGEGGRQSFATAFISEQGNGMVLSSLYTRDRMRIYAKPIAEFSSTYELTEEEQHALTEAKKRIAVQ